MDFWNGFSILVISDFFIWTVCKASIKPYRYTAAITYFKYMHYDRKWRGSFTNECSFWPMKIKHHSQRILTHTFIQNFNNHNVSTGILCLHIIKTPTVQNKHTFFFKIGTSKILIFCAKAHATVRILAKQKQKSKINWLTLIYRYISTATTLYII